MDPQAHQAVQGIAAPAAFVTNEQQITPTPMPDTEGRWATTRFVDPADMSHDMHVNIVAFLPDSVIPFAETHAWSMACMCLKARPLID